MKPPNERARRALSTEAALFYLRWLRYARDGWSSSYHTGRLAEDRQFDPSVDRVATLFWRAHLLGLVDLTQARVGPEESWQSDAEAQYNYKARRTALPVSETIELALSDIFNPRRQYGGR